MKRENLEIDANLLQGILNSPFIFVIPAALLGNMIESIKVNNNMFKDYYSIYEDDILETAEKPKKYDCINGYRIQRMSYRDEVFEFIKRLVQEFPDVDCTNLYNNINELRIRNESFLTTINHLGGYYDPTSNRLVYNNKFPEAYRRTIMYHELLHMASSYKSDKKIYSGFSQVDNKIIVGMGINEGYTQLLTERINPKITLAIPYEFENKIVRKIEQIVGQDKMQDLYFKADLPGLIDEMTKYSTRSEVIKFINEVDFVHTYRPIKIKKEENYMLREAMNDINNFLSSSLERSNKNLTKIKKTR